MRSWRRCSDRRATRAAASSRLLSPTTRRSGPAWSVTVSSNRVRARSVRWPRSEWPRRVPATDPRRQAARIAPAPLDPYQGVKVGKNVAVFVDVANIFYAAKAAGTDIDYVTLLKAATAGRDFVRAYAYTGLDPDNENQRNFHSFLARNGYKVISKDIRKYGDGRIKANLDIELVVDMMKTSRNLDIAVVVSGDGDFASAIRAVQEMGVRVEVISFRGNTSSDLIEVADLFTDIAQIARVDKSGRSGRRVAAEGDLSMTEVPEKETEGAPRRRRGVRGGRDDARQHVPEPEDQAHVVALPGERLSRAADGEPEPAAAPIAAEAEDEAADGSQNGEEIIGEDGRRRRRRRGGRGRGRGRRPEDEAVVTAGGEPSGFDEDADEEFEELPTAQPPVHTFGSVWDSQLGVPTSASLPPTVDLGGSSDDEEDYDEPEVPEYLLAERRQRGQRPAVRGGRPVSGGRNRSAYQAALDRERYGSRPPPPTLRGGGNPHRPQPGSGGGGNPNRQQPSGNRDRNRQGNRSPQGGRQQDRGPRPQPQYSEPRSSSGPWSEVPPELEEMLRAELARKQGPQPSAELTGVEAAPSSTPPMEAMAEADEQAARSDAPAKPARRTRATTSTTKKPATASKSTTKAKASASEEPAAPAASAAESAEAPAQEATKAPAKRATRARSTKSTAASAAPTDASAEPAAAAEPETPK